MKYYLTLIILFFSHSSLATEISFNKLICTSSGDDALIEVIFPRPTFPSRPFMGFAQIWGKVTLEHRKLKKKYVRERVLFIPETRPPGADMRGQSSDSLYIQLHPQFSNNEFSGVYHGQLFINDKDDEFRGTYFRYMNNESAPGILCYPEI